MEIFQKVKICHCIDEDIISVIHLQNLFEGKINFRELNNFGE